jgi:probable HAF family extracellular repeat protein
MTTHLQKKLSTFVETIVTALGSSISATDTVNASVGFDYSVTDLGTLGGSWSYAFRINDAEEIVGYSITHSGVERAFKWNNGVMTDLGTNTVWNNDLKVDLSTLGSAKSVAHDINKAGQVVGYSYLSTSSGRGSYHAFLWDNGSTTDLGTLGGSYSKAFSINNKGQIVGESLTSSGSCHAFVWNDGRMLDLNNLLSPNSGWILHRALGINNKGQIVGGGIFKDQLRAFLLTPVKVSD